MINANLISSALAELSSLDCQMEIWTGKDQKRMSSFIECVSELFDDSGLSDQLENGIAYSSAIDRMFRVLSLEVDTVDWAQPFDLLLRDPSLARARETAGRILKLLPDHPQPAPE
jgi:hypothetical protein